MPFSGTAAWNTATAALGKSCVYIVRFTGYDSVQFSSGPVKSSSRTTKQYLAPGIGSVAQTLDPITGAVSIGGWSFVLTDVAGEITDLISTEKASPTLSTLINRKVSILVGYADVAEADYATMGIGYVTDIDEVGAAYEFKIGDPKRKIVEDVFTNAKAASTKIATTFQVAESAGSAKINPASTTGITAGDALFVRNAAGQEELVEVRSISGSGNLNLKAALVNAYAIGDEIRWAATVVKGNPVNVFYSVLTGSFLTTGSFPLTTVKGLPTGLGMAVSEIDTAMLITERDEWLTTAELSFEIKSKMRAKDFLEKEVFRFFGYPIVTPAGLVGFKAFGPRRPTETIFELKEADILSWSWGRRYDLAVNRVVVKSDYDAQNDRFITTTTVEDSADQASVGVKEREVESKGLLSTGSGPGYVDMYARRHLSRYTKGPPELIIRTHLTKRGAAPGETVDLTHAKIPNQRTGSRSESPTTGKATGTWEIIRVAQDFEAGAMELTLLDNNWTRPMFVAPAGQPDYGSATAEQKKRWYISPPGGANFADGTEPYKVI